MQRIVFYCLFTISIVLFVTVLSFSIGHAGEIVDTDTIYWDWCGPTPEDSGLPSADSIANDLRFHLYVSEESGNYDIGNPDVVISYLESAGDPLDYEFNISITGVSGETKTLYFVLTAWYAGEESETSNEVSKEVTIPREVPLNLRFTVTVQ